MAAESCKICKALRTGANSGAEGFCGACVDALTRLGIERPAARAFLSIPRPPMDKTLLLKWLEGQNRKGTKGASSGKQAAKKAPAPAPSSGSAAAAGSSGALPAVRARWQQHQVDVLYDRHLVCPRLRIAVRARSSGGFGDLINCLNTSHLLAKSGNKWRTYASCDHSGFDQMMESFPSVRELEDDPERQADASWVVLNVIAKGGSVEEGAIDEYGYQSQEDAQTVYSRGAGLAPHELGIMINRTLQAQRPIETLRLASGGLQHCLTTAAREHTHRLFFGYGAGQKAPDCFHVLMDRVLFDDSIRCATILPVGHKPGHLDAYLKNQERWKALAQGMPPEAWKDRIRRAEDADCLALQLPFRDRAIQLLFPKKPLAYADMLQLWQAADRSFTICEGDQSFSEALSARIPMAYQLWNPDSGEAPHKVQLFNGLLTFCGDKPKVVTFLRAAMDYGRRKFDPESVKVIIDSCNTPLFLAQYVECMDRLAQHRDIASMLPGFVKRLWLRKIRGMGIAPDLHEALDELFRREDTGAELASIEGQLVLLRAGVQRLATQLTGWRPETDSYLRSSPRPSDLNWQVASALAAVQPFLKEEDE